MATMLADDAKHHALLAEHLDARSISTWGPPAKRGSWRPEAASPSMTRVRENGQLLHVLDAWSGIQQARVEAFDAEWKESEGHAVRVAFGLTHARDGIACVHRD